MVKTTNQLWLFNIAMENVLSIDDKHHDLPVKNDAVP